MKRLFPALCWAILIGGFLAACSKKPRPTLFLNDPPPGEPLQEDKLMPKEKAFDLSPRPPHGPIYFDFDSYAMKETETVSRLAAYLRATAARVSLVGYTSQEGTDDYNLHLGARRAQAVRDYLEASGISEDRITWTSFGEENPVTNDPAQYPLNRRVEFTLEDPK